MVRSTDTSHRVLHTRRSLCFDLEHDDSDHHEAKEETTTRIFPVRLPPELILEIASHLPFTSLLRLANTSAGNRILLRSTLLKTWRREFIEVQLSQPHPIGHRRLWGPYYQVCSVAMDEFGTLFELRATDFGEYTIRITRDPDLVLRPVRSDFQWLLWFLLVSNHREETLKNDLDLALGCDTMRDKSAYELIIELMELHKPGEESKLVSTNHSLGRSYLELVKSDGTREELLRREAEILKELNAIATTDVTIRDNCFLGLIQNIFWPLILQNKSSTHILRILDSLSITKIDGPPAKKLDFDALDKLSAWEAAGPTNTSDINHGCRKRASLFQHLELIVPAFPSLLNTTIDVFVRGERVKMDTATWVCFQAYEWLLSNQKCPLHQEDFWDRPHTTPIDSVPAENQDGTLVKKDWASTVLSLFRILAENGADFKNAMKACFLGDYEMYHISDYADYGKITRLSKGMYKLVLMMLEVGADPNFILPSPFVQDLYREDWTPLHVRDPPEEWEKALFYAFLRSDYKGWKIRNTRNRIPAHYLVDRIIDGNIAREILPSGYNKKADDPFDYEHDQDNALAYSYEKHGYKGGRDEVMKTYLTLLEAILTERPECLELDEWAYVLDLVEKERKAGRNEDLVRVVDEAERQRVEKKGHEPGFNDDSEQRRQALKRMRRYYAGQIWVGRRQN